MSETIIVTAENIDERRTELLRLESKRNHPGYKGKNKLRRTRRKTIKARIKALKAAIRQWEEDACWAQHGVTPAKSSPSDLLLIMSPATA